MTTKIKVTLDTDQWDSVWGLIRDGLTGDVWLGQQRVGELRTAIKLAAEGTGEGEPCQCEEVDGE